MTARKPEELSKVFAEAMNSGDLDALVSLYESDASFVPEPGHVSTGHQAIREALAGFLALKPKLSADVKTLVEAGDIALATANWRLDGTDPDGNALELAGQSVEVLGRQPDGTWLFKIDYPFGLGWDSQQ
jgi:uncharacterized protein (TIGR02246 family)